MNNKQNLLVIIFIGIFVGLVVGISQYLIPAELHNLWVSIVVSGIAAIVGGFISTRLFVTNAPNK